MHCDMHVKVQRQPMNVAFFFLSVGPEDCNQSFSLLQHVSIT